MMSTVQMGEGLQAVLVSMSIGCIGFRVRCDNSAAITIASGSGTWKSRSILNRLHYVRQAVESGVVDLTFVGTNGQLADLLTKCLTTLSLERNKRNLRMQKAEVLLGCPEVVGFDCKAATSMAVENRVQKTIDSIGWVNQMICKLLDTTWLRDADVSACVNACTS